MWRWQVEGLSDIRRVLAPDLAGHGERDAEREVATMDAIAHNLAEELDHEGADQVDLAGFSMGGYVAFAFWRLYPERVRRLILVDTRATADTEEGRKGRDAMAAGIRDRGAIVAAEAMLPKLLSEEAERQVRDEVAEMTDQPPDALIADLHAMRDRPDSTPDLPRINVPTLVIVGERDVVTPPSDAQAMASAIPGARLVTIPGAAHLAPYEQPDAVNAAIREFLES